MRIALVSEFYYPHLGGVTEHVHHLAGELNRAGHETVIVTARMGRPARAHDLPGSGDPPFVRRIGSSRTIYSAGSFARITTGFGLRRQLREQFRRERIDLVHVHGGLTPTLGLAAPDAAWELGLPVVATFHSWFSSSVLCRLFRRPLQRRLDQHAAAIAVSQPVVDAHARYFESDWEIIPNGVDTEFFRPDAAREPPTGDPELLFLGRLDPRNGLDTVLKALPCILQHHPAARLTIAGDGPLRPLYERLARPLGERVEFVGRVNGNRPSHYARANLYLCPTTKASFGITLLEAMACGTPILASDITGFRELVAHGTEARLVPSHRPDAWALAVLELLQDRRRLQAMGEAGRAKADRFAWPRIARQVIRLYRRVLSC
ncbi:MAG TPA: glycosyltransferase family 4 protein [Gemmatimonadales bacterium]|jgi:phosphatidylinositol alpha-mannosyltransferase|nr:glycosyltransferase family 4 protein [Gemmatimonadales bacterium]